MTVFNFPSQPTPFIGRENELAEIENLLGMSTCRLLTLVGPGGIGKTRLAIEAARSLLSSSSIDDGQGFRDGVYFIPLQRLTSPDFIVPAIADALHFTFYGESSSRTQLLHYLREKQPLLLLDNFEHLLDGTDLLPQILEYAPGVKLLVTSRERLHLIEEWVLDISGLAYPEHDTRERMEDYSAVQLFIQSAWRAGYIPSDADNASIVHICQMVEGIPLAIELAATWVRVMPCIEIAGEIERNLDILTTMTRNMPAKHHSMRAVFDHSWTLLSVDEQAVFRQLSVFRGGFTRKAAEQVVGASLPALASLVDKSLLRMDSGGRFDVHELLQQYAREKLTEAGEAKIVMDRHRDYFLAFAEQAEPELFGPHQLDWLNRVETELGNIRAAIGWSVERETVAASLRLTGALHWFWSQHGYHHEGYERLMAILSLPQAGARTLERAKALMAAGSIQAFEANYGEARPLLEEASAITREVGDRRELSTAVRMLGHVLFGLGEFEAAVRSLKEGLSLARQLRDHHNTAWSLVFLGDLMLHQGELEQAQQLYEEGMDLLRALNDKAILAYALRRLGCVMRGFHDYERSQTFCQESVELNFAIGDRRAVAAGLIGLAGLAVEQADAFRAVQLLAAADQLLNDMAAHLMFPDQLEYERHLSNVRAQLNSSTFSRVWEEGQSMSMERAIALALEDPATLVDSSLIKQPANPALISALTEREHEILRLVGSGSSTLEVAQQLYLSVGTVRWYLKQIYSKLDVHGRVQAIARARELKLLD